MLAPPWVTARRNRPSQSECQPQSNWCRRLWALCRLMFADWRRSSSTISGRCHCHCSCCCHQYCCCRCRLSSGRFQSAWCSIPFAKTSDIERERRDRARNDNLGVLMYQTRHVQVMRRPQPFSLRESLAVNDIPPGMSFDSVDPPAVVFVSYENGKFCLHERTTHCLV